MVEDIALFFSPNCTPRDPRLKAAASVSRRTGESAAVASKRSAIALQKRMPRLTHIPRPELCAFQSR